MGQSKEQKALYAQLAQAIADLKNPADNPAQNALTSNAMESTTRLANGDLPKGMFFNYSNPVNQMKQFDNGANINQTGTFGASDNSGAGEAAALAGVNRGDLFARSAVDNYQGNINQAVGNIQASLGQAAGAKSMNDQAVISSLQNMYNNAPQGFSWSNLLAQGIGAGSQVASAYLTQPAKPGNYQFKPWSTGADPIDRSGVTNNGVPYL